MEMCTPHSIQQILNGVSDWCHPHKSDNATIKIKLPQLFHPDISIAPSHCHDDPCVEDFVYYKV